MLQIQKVRLGDVLEFIGGTEVRIRMICFSTFTIQKAEGVQFGLMLSDMTNSFY